jgi:hypothetical protein
MPFRLLLRCCHRARNFMGSIGGIWRYRRLCFMGSDTVCPGQSRPTLRAEGCWYDPLAVDLHQLWRESRRCWRPMFHRPPASFYSWSGVRFVVKHPRWEPGARIAAAVMEQPSDSGSNSSRVSEFPSMGRRSDGVAAYGPCSGSKRQPAQYRAGCTVLGARLGCSPADRRRRRDSDTESWCVAERHQRLCHYQ